MAPKHRVWRNWWVCGLITGSLALALGSCQPDDELAQVPVPDPAAIVPWPTPVPANLAASIPAPGRNPLSRAGVALGKQLFFDKRLSGTNAIACATCHEPARAFSDGVKLTMAGVSRRQLHRNTPALQNLAWANGYFWEGGATDLESQAFGPLTSPDEMAQDLRELVQELRAAPEYPAQFERVFPGLGITSATIARALAQFQRTLISGNSRYDRWARREPGFALSPDEQAGLLLVRARCGSCHAGEFFTDFGYHNNGLDTAFSADLEHLAWGRGRITDQPADIGKYKTPSLRNVALTAPYMHDGRFRTLAEVLDHYSSGIRPSPTLAPVLQNGLTFSPDEKRRIVAFLETLTDSEFAR